MPGAEVLKKQAKPDFLKTCFAAASASAIPICFFAKKQIGITPSRLKPAWRCGPSGQLPAAEHGQAQAAPGHGLGLGLRQLEKILPFRPIEQNPHLPGAKIFP
jgi:hypothetical protein